MIINKMIAIPVSSTNNILDGNDMIEEYDGDFGEIYTILDFKNSVIAGGFTDDDGSAYVCEENGEHLFPISCEEIANINLNHTAITHIRWYNK